MNGLELVNIITTLIVFLLFVLVVFLINKYIIKGTKKAFIIELVSIWLIILILNILCVTFNAPFGIGIPIPRIMDGGVNKHYVSPGYTIHVYNPNNKIHAVNESFEKEPISTTFEF